MAIMLITQIKLAEFDMKNLTELFKKRVGKGNQYGHLRCMEDG